MSIELTGITEMTERLKNASKDTIRNVEKAVTEAAVNIRGRAVKKVQQGPATGRTYKSKVANRDHTASAPGQPPMSDSGNLANSIQYDLQGTTAFVGSNVQYAVYLEFGTRKMEARPFLFPSLEEETPAFRKALSEVIK